MKRAREVLLTLLLLGLVVRVLWWSIAPTIPYLLGGLVLVLIAGALFYRSKRW